LNWKAGKKSADIFANQRNAAKRARLDENILLERLGQREKQTEIKVVGESTFANNHMCNNVFAARRRLIRRMRRGGKTMMKKTKVMKARSSHRGRPTKMRRRLSTRTRTTCWRAATTMWTPTLMAEMILRRKAMLWTTKELIEDNDYSFLLFLSVIYF